jgi:hypothetical protein
MHFAEGPATLDATQPATKFIAWKGQPLVDVSVTEPTAAADGEAQRPKRKSTYPIADALRDDLAQASPGGGASAS